MIGHYLSCRASQDLTQLIGSQAVTDGGAITSFDEGDNDHGIQGGADGIKHNTNVSMIEVQQEHNKYMEPKL